MAAEGGVMDDNVLPDAVRVINIGLAGFADDLAAEGVPVVQMDWRPPAGGNERMAALLADLDDED
jgi:FdrA protein